MSIRAAAWGVRGAGSTAKDLIKLERALKPLRQKSTRRHHNSVKPQDAVAPPRGDLETRQEPVPEPELEPELEPEPELIQVDSVAAKTAERERQREDATTEREAKRKQVAEKRERDREEREAARQAAAKKREEDRARLAKQREEARATRVLSTDSVQAVKDTAAPTEKQEEEKTVKKEVFVAQRLRGTYHTDSKCLVRAKADPESPKVGILPTGAYVDVVSAKQLESTGAIRVSIRPSPYDHAQDHQLKGWTSLVSKSGTQILRRLTDGELRELMTSVDHDSSDAED